MIRCNFHTKYLKSNRITQENATTISISTKSMSQVLMTNKATPELLSRIEQKKNDMKTARRGMAEGIKYSSRSLGGHTTQYRRLCALAGIKIDVCKPTEDKPQITIGKPCRYKACKGRNHALHGEKCPVASARGKTGGKSGEGDSKRRVGEANGRYIDGRKKAAKRQLISQVVVGQNIAAPNYAINASGRKIINLISWRDQALTTAAVAHMVRGVDGVCGGCRKTLPAIKSVKIHRADIACNPARVICDACE